MASPSPFPASVLRPPSPDATCTCSHWAHCDCGCHDRHCDPTHVMCDVDFLPDEGGLTPWGCDACTPGRGTPHLLGCELIGWNVMVPRAGVSGSRLTRFRA
jgi:hypothetical protein